MAKVASFAALMIGLAGLAYESLVDLVFFRFVGIDLFSLQVALQDPYLWIYFGIVLLAGYALTLKTVPAPLSRLWRRRVGAAVLGGPLLVIGLIMVILLIIGGLAFLWLLATSPILQIALGIGIIILAVAAAAIFYTKARYG